MNQSVKKNNVISIVAIAFAFILAMFLSACSATEDGGGASPSGQSSETVKIGTMPTEDMLPMWVAEQEGLFEENGVDVEIVSFDSAPALSSAIAAGEVDMAMTDVMRAVKLCESGSSVDLEWVTLGTEADQGRFGILAFPDAPYSNLNELADYFATQVYPEDFAVGVASNTVPEYVFDKLCEQEGIDPTSIPTIEVASLPERYSLMASGKIAAGAFPGSLLALGEANGMVLLADDTQGENISQSVMVARSSFAKEHADQIDEIAQAWNEAVDMIASDKDAYLALLSEKANLNESISSTYPVSDYPYAIENGVLLYPEEEQIDAVISWMQDKGYGGENATYNAETGIIEIS